MNQNIIIKKLEERDLKFLREITPPDWGDITSVYRDNFSQEYFYPIKMIFEDQIIGVGELILNGKIGWLGNIIVRPEFRNKGLGKLITEKLIEMAWERNCESIYLLATSLGKYVYQKLGFKENGLYLFYQSSLENVDFEVSKNIHPFHENYKNEIFELDHLAMGEDRSKVLSLHLASALVYKESAQDKISGFYIPTLGNGLTICNNTSAGFDFIKKREQLGFDKIVLPEECVETIDFIEKRGYSICREPATFMYLGKLKTWNPKMVYCRIGGYLG